MSKSTNESEYSIAAVSKLTGVSCHVLRVWERRYGYPVPNRSASGHRRYRHDQVLTLRKITELAHHDGRSISDLIADVKDGKIVVEREETLGKDDLIAPEHEVADFLECVLRGDFVNGDRAFERLHIKLGTGELIAQVVAPAMIETGDRWFRRRCAVYQERCVSGYLRRKLDAMIELARAKNSTPRHTVLIGTVQGDRHEGGVLIANLLLEDAGWQVINLGVDLPVSEYARAVEQLHPDALALSFVLSRNVNKRFEELSKIKDLPVFVGGRSILNYQGLAKRYGLIPVPGPIQSAIEQMVREYQSWQLKSAAVATAHQV